MEAGEFDDLPGAGKPLPDLSTTYDPSWWVRTWVKRERVRDAADELRRTVRREVPRLRLRDDEHARARLEQLRQAIEEINQYLADEDRLAVPE